MRLRGALAGKRALPEQEREREIVLADLCAVARFRPATPSAPPPYRLELAAERDYLRLSLIAQNPEGQESAQAQVRLPLMSFKRILRDYGILCANHFEALQSATAQQIESLDMARRSLHDEGAVLLQDSLATKIVLDQEAARKLFTVLFILTAAPAPGIALMGTAPAPRPKKQKPPPTNKQATTTARLVVFICNSNAIRSPIAAGLAQEILPADVKIFSAAAGDAREEPDGFVLRVMSERGHDLSAWKPLALEDLLPALEKFANQGTAMTIIALSKAAEPTVAHLAKSLKATAQKWRIADPSLVEFGQQARLDATRDIATSIGEKIKNLLAPALEGVLVADDVVAARSNSASQKNALHSAFDTNPEDSAPQEAP